jgi:hypothetical protein
MSKVIFLVRDFGPKKAEVVKAIREQIGLGLPEISQASSAGKPLLERKLFDRENPDLPVRLLDLMIRLDGLNANYAIFELLDNQVFSSAEKYHEINSGKLRNMIEARETSLNQQRILGELEGDAS